MQTVQELADSLEKLYKGPWMSVPLEEHLQQMTARDALKRLQGSHNSWELVNHLIYWHRHVQEQISARVSGTPDDFPGDFYLPEDQSEENWQQALAELEQSFSTLIAAIRSFPEDKLYDPDLEDQESAWYYIHGIVEHDAYHLGQIALIRKYA